MLSQSIRLYLWKTEFQNVENKWLIKNVYKWDDEDSRLWR